MRLEARVFTHTN